MNGKLKIVWICFCLVGPLSGQSDWNISPMVFRIQAAPGDTLQEVLTVANKRISDRRYRLYMSDWRYTEAGEDVDVDMGEESRGCAAWIAAAPQNFSVPGNGIQTVRITMTIPKDAGPGTYWGGIFVEPDEAPELAHRVARTGGAYEIYMKTRVKAYMLVTIGGTLIQEGEVRLVHVERDPSGSGYRVITHFRNTGNLFLKCTGRVDIRNSNGDSVGSLEIAEFNVLPQYERTVEALIQKPLIPGEYSALVVIDFKGEFLVAGEAFFEVTGNDGR